MESIALLTDCMEYMRALPDKAFDLAIVDPPYGDGLHTENGGCMGWFEKYHENKNGGGGMTNDSVTWTRFGQRFDKYKRKANEWNAQADRGRENTGKKS